MLLSSGVNTVQKKRLQAEDRSLQDAEGGMGEALADQSAAAPGRSKRETKRPDGKGMPLRITGGFPNKSAGHVRIDAEGDASP